MMKTFEDASIYIKADSNQPQAATYQMTENEVEILEEKENYIQSQNTIVLTSGYTVTEEELSEYKANGELKTGQANPFDETPITDVLYDAEGNAYYKVITNRNEITTNNQWYGTVSGDSRGITTTNTTTTTTTNTTSNQTQTSNTTESTKNTATTNTTMTNKNTTSNTTQTKQITENQVYNPTTDITAPSTDSGNLTKSTGTK